MIVEVSAAGVTGVLVTVTVAVGVPVTGVVVVVVVAVAVPVAGIEVTPATPGRWIRGATHRALSPVAVPQDRTVRMNLTFLPARVLRFTSTSYVRAGWSTFSTNGPKSVPMTPLTS